jgi:hypothetical protein
MLDLAEDVYLVVEATDRLSVTNTLAYYAICDKKSFISTVAAS